jgi:hypothetical protein
MIIKSESPNQLVSLTVQINMDPNEVTHLLNETEEGDQELVFVSSAEPNHTTDTASGMIPIHNASNFITNFNVVSTTRTSSTDSQPDEATPNKWPKIQQVFGRSETTTPATSSASQLLQSNIHIASDVSSDDSQPEHINLDDSEDSNVSLSAKSSLQLIVSDGEGCEKTTDRRAKEKRSRKSQHVVRVNCESPTFEFEEADDKSDESSATASAEVVSENAATDNPNEVLMKKLAFLRTATNFVLKETGRKPFLFKHKLDTINFVDLYREIDHRKK